MSGSMPGAANARTDADARPWLEFYPPGVPAEIDPARAGTLVDLFRESVSRYANQPALESFGKQLTYVELSEAATAVASWLQERGLGKGDCVAIMLQRARLSGDPLWRAYCRAGRSLMSTRSTRHASCAIR